MDNQKPDKIVEDLIQSGAYKSTLAAKDILLRGFFSGSLLGFATVLAFTTTVQTGSGVLGALVFPVSFVMIVLLGMELVTGNFATVPMAVMDKKSTMAKLSSSWLFAFTGNLIGSVFFGTMFYVYITKLGYTYEADMIGQLILVAESKTLAYKSIGTSGLIVVFVKAILCNWMVALGVVMGMVSTSTTGKIFAIWLPIFTFFALALEHSVVNMFVIPTAIMLGADITIADWWLWNQIPVTLGNIVGGAVFTGGILYATHYKKAKAEDKQAHHQERFSSRSSMNKNLNREESTGRRETVNGTVSKSKKELI